MRTFLHRLLGLTRTRGFDAAGGGRRWEGARTVDGLNTAILAGATTAARRAGWGGGKPLCAEIAGFTLLAATRCRADDRHRLVRLCR